MPSRRNRVVLCWIPVDLFDLMWGKAWMRHPTIEEVEQEIYITKRRSDYYRCAEHDGVVYTLVAFEKTAPVSLWSIFSSHMRVSTDGVIKDLSECWSMTLEEAISA